MKFFKPSFNAKNSLSILQSEFEKVRPYATLRGGRVSKGPWLRDFMGKHMHVEKKESIQLGCSNEQCHSPCSDITNITVLGNFTHTAPRSVPTVKVADEDVNGKPKVQLITNLS